MFDETSFTDAKKNLLKLLKLFDKNYTKHKKKYHAELQKIIDTAFDPLKKVLHSNIEFHKLELLMLKDPDIPMFRHKALEEQFCIHMEKLLTILTDHGKLREEFNIQRMLDILKIDQWQESIPMDFYIRPLQDSIISL